MDVDTPWSELEAAALLGTERRPFTPAAMPGALGTAIGGLAGREPERVLLGTAAVLATVRRAGRQFGRESAPGPDRAPLESRPRCPAAAGIRLGSMLAGESTELLLEWLGALERAGGRAPEEHLPALLDRARADRRLRPAILAVVGERGRWLARLNPDWTFVARADASPDPADAEALWQTGTAEQRSALLRRLRPTEPGRARELLATTWAADGPRERATFVADLEVGLGPDDEPFLESALDDRRKEVRQAAAELLVRLPESRLVGRMRERAAAWLGLERVRPGDEPFAHLALPEACDKAMIRDGIEPKPGRPGLGERAWWLGEVVGRIPPGHWARVWGLSPDAVVAAVLKGQWRDPLYPALLEAARRSGDADWIEALMPHWRLAGPAIDTGEVIASLPEDRREPLALALLHRDGAGAAAEPLGDDLMLLLEQVPAPWGEALAGAVLERCGRRVATERYFDYAMMRFLMHLRRCVPAGPALQAAARWTLRGQDRPPTHQQPYDDFLAVLQFRIDMIGELS